MKIRERIGSRYAVMEMISEEPLTTFLDPTEETRAIAKEIEKKSDRMYKRLQLVTEWVYNNIKYQPDEVTTGAPEMFSSPTVTLRRKVGDCEDMAFLICAIANSFSDKIPEPNYVTIGYYQAGIKPPFSFHAWAYCGKIVCDGTAGFVTVEDDERYNPILGISRHAIYILKPISYFTRRDLLW